MQWRKNVQYSKRKKIQKKIQKKLKATYKIELSITKEKGFLLNHYKK